MLIFGSTNGTYQEFITISDEEIREALKAGCCHSRNPDPRAKGHYGSTLSEEHKQAIMAQFTQLNGTKRNQTKQNITQHNSTLEAMRQLVKKLDPDMTRTKLNVTKQNTT